MKDWKITAREVQVITLVAQGRTQPQVGKQLKISHETVRSHLHRVARRIGSNTTSNTIHMLICEGYIKVPSTKPVDLTYVQKAVLRGEAQGLTQVGIAEANDITEWQVDYALKQLYQALGVHDRNHAVYRGHQTGNLTRPKPEEQ